MKILLKNATLLNPSSPHHSSLKDILIVNGTIGEIGEGIKPDRDTKIIAHENLHVSNGWTDCGVSFGEPGYEERETISHGLEVAAKSGFTKILLNANTDPLPDSSSNIGHLIKMGQGHTTSLFPIGTLSVGSKGKQMASLFDMHTQGAIAFGDHKKSIDRSNLLKIALQYCQSFGGTVFSYPQHLEIAGNGVMHEGATSAGIGLKGIPEMAESIQVARDLEILKYTGGKLHIPNLSTQRGVDLVRDAKKIGLNVSCSVGLPHLFFDDSHMEGYNPNLKIFPPIRSKTDQKALQAGLLEGTIDMVSSMHEPMNIEHKQLEFEHAEPGSIGLESCFGILNKIFPLDHVINFLTRGAGRFGIDAPNLEVGAAADITFFDPHQNFQFSAADIKSTSKNSAFLGQELQGKVIGSFNNGKLTIND